MVMTLSGVLKDILLVAISCLFYSEEVTILQILGYSIALAGLVYYRIGGEKLREHIGQAQRSWQNYSIRKPVASRSLVACIILVLLVVLLLGVHTSGVVPLEYTQIAQNKWNEYISTKTSE